MEAIASKMQTLMKVTRAMNLHRGFGSVLRVDQAALNSGRYNSVGHEAGVHAVGDTSTNATDAHCGADRIAGATPFPTFSIVGDPAFKGPFCFVNNY